MQNSPLERVLGYFRKKPSFASLIEVRANEKNYSVDQLQGYPSLEQIKEDARWAGAYLGRQGMDGQADRDVLIKILDAVFDIAISRQEAFEKITAANNASRGEYAFYELALKRTVDSVIEPMMRAIQDNDANHNIFKFKDLCDQMASSCISAADKMAKVYSDASDRLKRIYQRSFDKVTGSLAGSGVLS